MRTNEVICLAAFPAIKDPALEARKRMDQAGENDTAFDEASGDLIFAKAKSSKGALAQVEYLIGVDCGGDGELPEFVAHMLGSVRDYLALISARTPA